MEGSESTGAWDEGDDAPEYPAAPLPAHERTWRHPSEMGQATWTATEPPLAIGRGLMVTTGVIGCVLGVAILWLLTPVGGGLAPTAAPLATSSLTTARIAATATSPATAASTSPTIANPTLPIEEVPVNTVLLVTSDAAPRSIAVVIGADPYIVTTASAVSGTVHVGVSNGGDATDGQVHIEGDLAFIEPTSSIEVVGFAEVAVASEGQELLVLGEGVESITNDEAGTRGLDADDIVEGTPVVDLDGALVALCTIVIDATGAHVDLLPIAGAPGTPSPATTTATSSVPPPTNAWLGVRFIGGDGDDALTIAAVVDGSPADDAGLRVGERLTAIDGDSVDSVTDALRRITSSEPGTTMTLTMASPPSTSPDDGPTATVPGSPTTVPSGISTSTSIPTTGGSITPAAWTRRTVSVVLGVAAPSV